LNIDFNTIIQDPIYVSPLIFGEPMILRRFIDFGNFVGSNFQLLVLWTSRHVEDCFTPLVSPAIFFKCAFKRIGALRPNCNLWFILVREDFLQISRSLEMSPSRSFTAGVPSSDVTY
jgi:hypothetical protein